MVRRVFAALALCFCSLAMHGQKTRNGQGLALAKTGVDYPIKLHISGLHYRKEYLAGGIVSYPHTEEVVYADAVMNGKKVELRSDKNASSAYNDLPLGDFQARLIKDPHKMGDTPIYQVWEIVLPDRTLWRGTLTGIWE